MALPARPRAALEVVEELIDLVGAVENAVTNRTTPDSQRSWSMALLSASTPSVTCGG